MNKNFNKTLRWLAVIPGAILAGILVLFPLHLILYQTLSNFIDPYPETPERILGPLATSWAMVTAAAYNAPSNKRNVAIAMAFVWIFIAGGGFTLSYFELEISSRRLDFGTSWLPIMFGVIGSLLGLKNVVNQNS